MIRISVEEGYLKIQGHAEFDESGKDIVCSAISSIVTSSAEIWREDEEIKINLGEDYFEFRLEKNVPIKLEIEYRFMIKQLYLIAKEYPEYIKIIS